MDRYTHEDPEIQAYLDMRQDLGNLPDEGITEENIRRYVPSALWGRLKGKSVQKAPEAQAPQAPQAAPFVIPPSEEDLAREEELKKYVAGITNIHIQPEQPAPAPRPRRPGVWKRTENGWRYLRNREEV